MKIVVVLALLGSMWPVIWADKGRLRAIAVGNKVDLKYSQTYETWTAQWLDRQDLIEARGEINITTNPGLIVVGELIGLTSAFIGSRGQNARENASSIVQAFTMLAKAYAPQVEYYQSLYGQNSSSSFNMINAIEMALTDTMWRAFLGTFSALAIELQAYVVAGTLAPRIRASRDKKDITFFKDPDLSFDEVDEVYIADSAEVYNSAFIFSPMGGTIVGVIDKYHLTREDEKLLHLTPGTLESSLTYALGDDEDGVNVCVAICYDSFFDDVLSFHNSQNCSVLVQPSYNTAAWASYVNISFWQPDDWTRSTFASVSDRYPSIQYNVNAMQVGNLLDLPADGQSTITKKSMSKDAKDCYVGLDPSLNYVGEVVACESWVISDDDKSLPLNERRSMLTARAMEMLPGSGSINQNKYNDQVVFADLF